MHYLFGMPIPAKDLWSKIQKELRGLSEDEQLRVLRQHLGALHDEWKGPYKDLRDRLRRLVAHHEGHQTVRSRAGQHDPFHIARQGDARIAVAGLPNAGKSALVSALTNAVTVVADYPFTTSQPLPGMLSCDGGALQLIDTPPIVPRLSSDQGAGRPLLHLFSTADAVAVVVDLAADVTAQVETVFEALAEACAHPVPGPVATVLHMRGKGGIKFRGRPLAREDEGAARSILAAAHVEHAEVIVRTTFDQAVLQKQVDGEAPLPTVLIGTRAVGDEDDRIEPLRERWPEHRVLLMDTDRPIKPVSASHTFLEALGMMTVELLDRPAAEGPAEQVLIKIASDIHQVAEQAGVPLKHLKGARVWGKSVARPGQAVSLDHLAEVGDRIYLQS